MYLAREADRRERLGNRSQVVERVFGGGSVVLEIGKAESVGPLVFSVFDHGDRNSRNVRRGHEFGDRGLDLGALLSGEFVLLGEAGRCAESYEQNDGEDLVLTSVREREHGCAFRRR